MFTVVTAYTLSECMDELVARVKKNEERGERNLIFCEDRLTLVAERALASALGGTFLTSVTTFARYLSAPKQTVSKQGSVMAVANGIAELWREGKLHCFKADTGVGNNAKAIYETLAQLFASEVDGELLRESAAQLTDDVLKRKITDLAEISDRYVAFLDERGFMDESRYLSLLPSALREDKSLSGTNVFFLCYTSFTAQALRAVRAALESARGVYGVFCGGEEDIYTNRAAQTFTRVCKEYEDGQTLRCGVPLDGEAEALRKGLFNPERAKKTRVTTDKIHLFEADDKTAEAEYVAVQIRRAMAEDSTLRYRDFAVLTANTEAYSLALKRAFGEYGVPYFIDEKKSLKRHPLAEFLSACFRVVAEKYSPASVQALTQNVFFGESDDYRNYLLKFANYRGGAKREIKQSEAVTQTFDIAALQEARSRLLAATGTIKNKGTGKEYCESVRAILSAFHAREKLEEYSERIEDVSQKSYLSQIDGALDRLLTEAEWLTENREMTVKEFAVMLEDGLGATEISLIPLKKDAVFIGDLTESRIEKVAVLFAVGMTEDVPATAVDTAVISDRELSRLAEVKTRIEPTVAEVNLRSRECACLNLCTFLRELHLSYPLAADGSEPSVSDVLRYVDEVFQTAEGAALPRRKKLNEDEFVYRCAAAAPAVRELLEKRNEYTNKQSDTRRIYSSLYTALDKLSVQEKDDYLIEAEDTARIRRGEELFFKDGRISPTALEGYFSCPFRNYAERGLRLKEREETAVMAVDTGNFIHELLEITAKRAEEIDSDEGMYALALDEGRKILQKPVYAAQSDTASGEVFGEKLLAEGATVAVAAYRQIKNSKYRVEATEKSVYTDELRGKVDRVDGSDEYVRIVDYKTGSIDDSATSYYTGRKLQMQLYMSVLQGERIPAGVFYFPASIQFTEEGVQKFQMKGFMNGDRNAVLCGDSHLSEGERSAYFPAVLGDNARSKRVMDESEFRDFIDYSVHVARRGASELKQGYVAASPYKNGCEYCKYGGMCGFKRDKEEARNESSIDPSAIAAIAKKQREGER